MEYEEQEETTDQMEIPPHSHQQQQPPQPQPSYDSALHINSSYRPRMTTSPVMLLESPRKSCRYRECLKNHAVGLGGHAVDGCCEFMPAGVEGTLDALKCAACNCHRNFHRKEPTGGGAGEVINYTSPHQLHHPHQTHQQQHYLSYYRSPSGYLHVAAAAPQQQRPLALPSTSGGGGSQEQEEDMSPNPMNSALRKRHRTKFTAEQKDRMMGLAERLGWRIQKQDEEAVQQFCEETGVRRHVLKVWMHNNKHTLGKKP